MAYLTYLGLVRGHLDIGVDLYREGAQDPAKTHMKHPGDKLYADLAPALERRGAQGFANELEGLAMLVENGAPVSRGRACPSSRARPDRASRGHRLRIRRPRLKTRLETIRNLVRTAAEEYAVALRDEQ